MRVASGILAGLFLLVAAAAGGWLLTRERFVLCTYPGSDRARETVLWAAREGLTLWIEAASPDEAWYRDLVEQPVVQVRERGHTYRFLAEPVPGARARLRRLRREQYGWADLALRPLRDPERSVAVRLTRLPAEGPRAGSRGQGRSV